VKPTARALLVSLVLGLTAWVPTSSASAVTGTLLYSCAGQAGGFGTETSYPFTAVLDTNLPATVPYGPDRDASWTVQLVAPDSFRQWAVEQGFTDLYGGAQLTPAIDNAPLTRTTYAATPLMPVPTTPGAWAWATAVSVGAFPTQVPASTLGHHVVTSAFDVTVAFQKNGVGVYATSATCTLDPTVPAASAVVDEYDVVAATTATALAVRGDTATATVTSNGAKPNGTVTFTTGGESVTIGVVSGQATAKLPPARPGAHLVTATFTPTDTTQQTGSSATASYSADRLATRSRASAGYRLLLEQVKARSRVRTLDGAPATGRVTFILRHAGVTVANATVRLGNNGVARKTFRHVTASGGYVVVAKYLGNRSFKRSSDRARLTVS
jgi:hypothetical protein